MNRKTCLNIFTFAMISVAMAFLTSCSSSKSTTTPPPPTIAITANSGYTASAAVSASFGTLSATVTSNGSPASGVSVTFTAPSTGASGTFATTPAAVTDTEMTNASGIATSQAFTANTTAGSYSVTASTTGATTSASFALTNTAGAAATISATSGNNQSATVSTAFGSALAATVVDASNNPVSGVSVTFTIVAGGSGASGAFATTGATDTETTNASGVATTSQALTANATAGAFTVSAAATGVTAPAVFTETNTAVVVVSSSNYVFYASGEETINAGPNYYGVVGTVTIDTNGNILGGEQDYNDAFGIAATDTISAVNGALVAVDANAGLYTLTITTTDTNLGGVNTAAGVEEFVVQFVNSSHALITQFDGSATSSGSLDLQTTTSAANGSYAFTAVGVDNNTSNNYASVAIGGVVAASSGSLSGVYDIIDAGTGTTVFSTGNAITAGATLSSTDTYGRGTLTGSGLITASSVFAFYVVGPATGSQALRIIDMDANDVAVGSAYGQGSATFTNATFPTPTVASGLLTLLGQWNENYATLGEFTTDSNGNFTGGTADDNELDNAVQMEADSISGSTYNLVGTAANGYGTASITWGTAGPDVATLGVYMVDPALNINDPNNTTSTDVGGALLLDLDAALPGGIGVITPQTDTTVADFNGTYVAGFQNFNTFNANCAGCEFDMISQGTMTTGAALSLTGADSDPFGTWDGTAAESTGDTFTSTPLSVSTGFYSMSQGNNPENPIEATINSNEFAMDSDIYQASSTTLYWLEIDGNGVFLGPIVTQGSLTGVPAAKKPAGIAQPQPNKNIKPSKELGVTLHQ